MEEDIAGNCTAMYRAPELVDLYSRRFICEKVDVWALGCVWHGLLYGTLPFEGVSALQIAKGLRQVPTEPLYPPLYVPLLESMLTVDPALRPDIFQVLQAVSYMQGVQMQPDMQRAGVRLRELRAKDFGGVIGGFGERAELFGFEQAKLGAVSTRNDANMISTIASVPRQRPCVSMPDKDWTDFESAFCEISADAFSSKTISVGAVQDGKKVGRPSEKIGACVKQKTSVCPMGSSTGTASMALIDFSDMTDRRDKEQVERKKDGNGGGKFKDLIDFESNAFG